MKTLSANLTERLSRDLTTFSLCIKITRVDTTVLAFTDHDKTITYDGNNYLPTNSYIPSQLSSSANLEVGSIELKGALSSVITQDDIIQKKYDHAAVEIFYIDWQKPSDGIITVKKGWMGNVSVTDDLWEPEVRGLKQFLTQNQGRVYTPMCHYVFGDDNCGIDLDTLTVDGDAVKVSGVAVSSVTNLGEFVTAGLPTHPTKFFLLGSVEWSTGNNAGTIYTVRDDNLSAGDHTIKLSLPMQNTIQVGDTFIINGGCKKSKEACETFLNYRRFPGFPYIPGQGILSGYFRT